MIKTPLSTVIGGAFWTPSCTVIGGQQSFSQLIKKLFSNGEQGFFYNPNDLSTMYQDAAGTVPVTDVGQPVGLMLDKSKAVPANRRNLLYYTEDFTNVAWVKTGNPSGSPVDNGLVLAPDGTTTARSFTFGAATFIRQNNIPLNSGVIGYQSVWVRKGALSPANAIRLTQNNTLAWNTGGSSKIILTNQWQRISASAAVTGTNVRHIIFGSVDASGANDPDCNGSIELWHPQYELTGLTDYQKVESNYGGWVAGNHAYQTTSSMRPLLVASPQRLDYDIADDNLITRLPAQLTNCTVIRSAPNVGTQILTNQTIPATYNDNTDHCGLIVINRALTATETSQITKLFNKAAGV